MAAVAWCRLTVVTREVTLHNLSYKTSRASPCEDGYVYIPVAFVVMLYLVYLVECWHCHTRLQLQCKVDVNTVYERIQAMKDAMPIVWWKAVCYHYVRRTRQVTRYRNGDAFTTTQVYYERVNSHTVSNCFNFTNCGMKDSSKNLTNLENFPATKIKFSKGFSFSAYDAEQEFEDQRSHFFRTHERIDDYMETREGLDMMNTNFKEYMIAFADPDNLPWYVSQIVFWLASFFLMSWPLRVLIEYKTAHVHFHIHKMFGCNYPDTNYSVGQMTRVSTMESSELEMNIRSNYTMVPSYSEALLMECSNNDRQHQGYGAVTTPNGSIPLVHLGNSICIAPALNSTYISGNMHAGTLGPAGCIQNGHVQGTTYQNVHANGYIPLADRDMSNNHQCANNSSSETLPSVQRRQRRRRKRKRRRQSYTDAILGPSDNEAFEGIESEQRQTITSFTSTTSTPESPSERDSLTLPSRDSSIDFIESEGAETSSNGHELPNGAESRNLKGQSGSTSTMGDGNIDGLHTVTNHDNRIIKSPTSRPMLDARPKSISSLASLPERHTVAMSASSLVSPHEDNATSSTSVSIEDTTKLKLTASTTATARPKTTASVISPPDAPPAYELAIAMRRAAAAALPSGITAGRVGSITSSPQHTNRPTSLPATRSRVPTYQQEHPRTSVNDGETEPPIRLMETSL